MPPLDTTVQLSSPASAGSGLERRAAAVGRDLAESLQAVLDALPGAPRGPVELARALGVDKVLTSRMLKALRNRDPLSVVHLAPGPEPLRRVLRAAARRQVPGDTIAPAENAVKQFEELIRQEAGDRGALDAIISAWLPEARSEFELRRKQAAFKAMSQLKGVMAGTNLAAVLLHPSADGEHLDIVWITGLLGLHRLRPGVGVKFATRRFVDGEAPRRPTTLDGVPVDDLAGVRLDEFCSAPPPPLNVERAGDVVHYTLGETGFGPHAAVDLIFAEVNRSEMPRQVPPGTRRKGYVFAEIGTPSRALHFDAWLHESVYTGTEPALHIYDTALDGVADVNDPGRDIDRLETSESITALGTGLSSSRTRDVPDYADLLRHVCDRTSWDGDRFRGYRCRIDYPIYGSQVVMAWERRG